MPVAWEGIYSKYLALQIKAMELGMLGPLPAE
jgi:hypothetical protein